MTAREVQTQSTQAPKRIPGLASTAIHGLLTEPRIATVLGSSGYAVWLLVEQSVIVVSTADATRLPNSVEIAAGSDTDVFKSIHHGASVEIWSGRIMLEGLAVRITRWWDPRPVLPETTREHIAAAIAAFPSEVPDVDSAILRRALEDNSPTGILVAAKSMLGRGSGLTPEADDYLAGALAALRTIGPAIGAYEVESMLDRVSVALARLADVRTTAFSAALIHHALRGQVAAPAGALLRALAGRGNIAQSHETVSGVGHSSGPALAAGIVLGAETLTNFQRR